MVEVLDHGRVDYVEHWGSDERIVEAIRQSTQGGFVSWEPYEGHPRGDVGVLSYCLSDDPKHTGPFEFAGLVVSVQAPIMVYREWHRHRTQSYAEASARHTPLPSIDYMPTVERCLSVSKTNKQAGAVRGVDEITPESAAEWLEELKTHYKNCEAVYQSGLKRGVPKEIARLALTVGRYSKMRACANLVNWFRFLTLRANKKAQWEIQQFAYSVARIIAVKFPRTWSLFRGSLTGADPAAEI
jgi:thymidylate synthase (FAD)